MFVGWTKPSWQVAMVHCIDWILNTFSTPFELISLIQQTISCGCWLCNPFKRLEFLIFVDHRYRMSCQPIVDTPDCLIIECIVLRNAHSSINLSDRRCRFCKIHLFLYSKVIRLSREKRLELDWLFEHVIDDRLSLLPVRSISMHILLI